MRRRGRLRRLVRSGRRGATIAATKDFFGERDYGFMEESGGPRFGRRGSDFVCEEKISGGGVGHGGWSGDAGVGISGTVRKSAAIAAGLFRTRHARDGDGWASREANYRSGGAERGGSPGRNWGMKRLPAVGFGLPGSEDKSTVGYQRPDRAMPGAGWRSAAAVCSLDAELFAGFGAEAFGGPGRGPHHIHGAVADAGQLLDAGFDLRADVDVLGAALRGEGHFDGDVLLRFVGIVGGRGGKVHFVDQAQVDDVDRDLRIVATLQSAQDILFSDRGHCSNTSSSSLPYSCGPTG